MWLTRLKCGDPLMRILNFCVSHAVSAECDQIYWLQLTLQNLIVFIENALFSQLLSTFPPHRPLDQRTNSPSECDQRAEQQHHRHWLHAPEQANLRCKHKASQICRRQDEHYLRNQTNYHSGYHLQHCYDKIQWGNAPGQNLHGHDPLPRGTHLDRSTLTAQHRQ